MKEVNYFNEENDHQSEENLDINRQTTSTSNFFPIMREDEWIEKEDERERRETE